MEFRDYLPLACLVLHWGRYNKKTKQQLTVVSIFNIILEKQQLFQLILIYYGKIYSLLSRSQNFDFLGSNDLPPGRFLGSSNSRWYHWILILILILSQRLGSKTMCGFSISFNFERNYDVFKLKEFMNFVEQKYKL